MSIRNKLIHLLGGASREELLFEVTRGDNYQTQWMRENEEHNRLLERLSKEDKDYKEDEEESVLTTVLDQLGLDYDEFIDLKLHLDGMATRAKAGKNKQYLQQAAMALDILSQDR